MQKVYKIFVIENGELRNLFKSIEGSRTIEFDRWLKAENKMARDGGNSRKYLTGIHCVETLNDAIEYLDNFYTDKNRLIVECLAEDLRTKPTNDKVKLADWLYVPKKSFRQALAEQFDSILSEINI